jgi:hypothetical protein
MRPSHLIIKQTHFFYLPDCCSACQWTVVRALAVLAEPTYAAEISPIAEPFPRAPIAVLLGRELVVSNL